MSNVEDLLKLCSTARYLNAPAVGDGMFLTIDHIQIDTMKTRGKPDADKPVVYFVEDPRGWVMNNSTLAILREMFGSNTNAWSGKRLTLYNDQNIRVKQSDGSFRKGGIRIKSSPDIAQSFEIKVGGSQFRKPDLYQIRKVSVADPLADALTAFVLDSAQYDVWADKNGRPSFTETPAPVREKASQWIHGGGHEAIRRAATATEAADIPQVGEE